MSIQRFRKRPVVIEAMRWDGTVGSQRAIVDWAWPAAVAGWVDTAAYLEIKTLEGTMRADSGDWIIKEPFPTGDRQFYPCKPDIFEATYDPI